MSFSVHEFPDDYGPEDRSGHISVYWNGHLVIWGGFTVRFASFKMCYLKSSDLTELKSSGKFINKQN